MSEDKYTIYLKNMRESLLELVENIDDLLGDTDNKFDLSDEDNNNN